MGSDSYGGRVRIRVNGLLVRDHALLLVKLQSPVLRKSVWMPPGGGLRYGESLEQCLVREFGEETGLQIEVGTLRHINELLKPPYHAIEFYFSVTESGGRLELGSDPEHDQEAQLLEDLRFISMEEFYNYDIEPEYVRNRYPGEFDIDDGPIHFSDRSD